MTARDVLLGALVFVACATVDYAHARYQRAAIARRRWRAAAWSLTQWASNSLALYVAVGVSWSYLPVEAAGLALGTLLGVGTPREDTPC